jgi:tetratricopeptide (TPR) repeat protein
MQSIGRPNLSLSEEEVEKFYAYGFAHYGSGNWNEAADGFWFALGATLQEAGSYYDALHSWAMAALLKKEDPYPHFHAAECCFSLQMSEDAAKALKESEIRMGKEPLHPLKIKIGLLRQQWRL